MRKLFFLLFAALSFLPAAARAQPFSPSELEGLVAPIALYPDPVVLEVLNAARTGNPDALAAYPELQERMRENPQWMFDLGNAYLGQPWEVMDAVQALRQRAAATGYMAGSSGYFVHYYDPVIVYGPAWRPAYRPIYWRPWSPRPRVVVTRVVPRNGPPSPAVRFQREQQVQRQPQPFVWQPYHRIPESQRQPIVQSRVAPAFPRPAPSHPHHRKGGKRS